MVYSSVMVLHIPNTYTYIPYVYIYYCHTTLTRRKEEKLKYYGAREKLREVAEEAIYEKVEKGARELGL